MLDKRETRFLGLFILGVLVISMLVVAVSADTTPAAGTSGSPDNTVSITAPAGTQFSVVVEKIKDGATSVIESIFGKTFNGKSPFDLAFAKFLVFVLIMLIVYGLVGLLPFFTGLEGREKKAIHWIFSIIVAFISVMYVAPEEIYAALVGYGAMAVILTAIIPFAIILTLSWKLATDPTVTNMILQKILLWGFGVYLIFRLIMVTIYRDQLPNVYAYAWVIYGIMLAVVIIFICTNKLIRDFFFKAQIKAGISAADRDQILSLQGRIETRKRERSITLTGDTAETYDKITRNLEKERDELIKKPSE